MVADKRERKYRCKITGIKKGSVITDPVVIKSTMMKYYDPIYTKKFRNLKQRDKLLVRH